MIDRCIKQLRPQDQEIIELVYFKRRTHRQLAAIKRVSSTAIAKRLNRAIDALATLYF